MGISSMLDTILDITIIIFLTIVGLFYSKVPVCLIMLAAILMIELTYQAFEEEKKKSMLLVETGVMLAFAVLSGNVTGFLIFFFQKELKFWVRVCVGILTFVIFQLAIFKNASIAMCILLAILLLGLFLLFGVVYRIIEQGKNRKIRERERIVASNISELHEKQLNEQLMMQKLVDERNARLMERETISRNIHNSVGHSITAAILTLDAADMLYDVKPEEARKKMNDANHRIRESLESIRRAVRVLDEDNKMLPAKDLKSELDMIASEFVMDTDFQVHQNYSDIADDINIPHDYAVFLTGVLQEILTNGVKHGNANAFIVILSGDSAHVRLKISDNGNSDFSKTNREQRIEQGFGLKKILSYVESCGGKAEFINENGFQSMVELPIVVEEQGADVCIK